MSSFDLNDISAALPDSHNATSKPLLPPEIWARIIPMLRRSMNAENHPERLYDYHQHDLATAMRVNKLFYKFAAPILYERVIVSNFPLFLYGIPLLHPQDPPEIFDTPKVKLFKQIKRLDIAYTSLRSDQTVGKQLPEFMLKHLDLPSNVVPALTTDINLTHQAVLNPLMGWAMSMDAPSLFPNLETITTGRYGERNSWDVYNPNFTKLDYIPIDEDNQTAELQEAAGKLHELFKKQLFGRYLVGTISNPKHICNYVSSGPRTPVWNNHFPNDYMLSTRIKVIEKEILPKTYTTHLKEQILKGVWMNLAEGITNRWIIDSYFRELDDPVEHYLVFTFIQKQLITRREISSLFNIDKSTKIEIYGWNNKKMIRNAVNIMLGGNESLFVTPYSDEEGLATIKAFLGIGNDIEEDPCCVVELMDGDGDCPACGSDDD
ncbi:uncharacterized protein L201_000164 [Kwoniella dendrophila CBS 6074]|uniref:F-box domain-containing protein n=1 Tax=Kwoniella dendrophila CBS 6074 TaxID=1295534 RepID=A0AAX4JKH6_9TREE